MHGLVVLLEVSLVLLLLRVAYLLFLQALVVKQVYHIWIYPLLHLVIHKQFHKQSCIYIKLPSFREGWFPILEVLPLLARLPGGLVVREAAVRTFFKGKWCWPLPFLESPSADVVIVFRRALHNHSQCNWWCPGRFWADRVDFHPVLSCALGSAMVCLRFPGPPSRQLLDAVNHHLDRLGLQIASWSVAAVTVRLRSVGGLLRNLLPYVSYSDPDQAWTFQINRTQGAHALRLAARFQALSAVRRSRFDSEGVANVDLDASSHQTWSSWRSTLSSQQKLLLVVFRGGGRHFPYPTCKYALKQYLLSFLWCRGCIYAPFLG